MSVDFIVPIAATAFLALIGYLYREHRIRAEPPHPDAPTWKTCTLLAFCDTNGPLPRRVLLRKLNTISINTINDIAASNNFRSSHTKRVFRSKVIADLKHAMLIQEAGGHTKKTSSSQYYELTLIGDNSIRNIFDEIHGHLVEKDFSALINHNRGDKFLVGTIPDAKSQEEVVEIFSPVLSGQALKKMGASRPQVPAAQHNSSKTRSSQRELTSEKSSGRRGSSGDGNLHEFRIQFGSSYRATGYLKDSDESRGGLLVRQGSMAAKAEAPSIPQTYSTLRRRLTKDGILGDQGDHYSFLHDYLFSSPSAASSVVLGRSSNGRQEWKSGEGGNQSLGDALKMLADEPQQRSREGEESSSSSPAVSPLKDWPPEIRYAVFRVVLEKGPIRKDDLMADLPGKISSWSNLSAKRRKLAKNAIRWNVSHKYLRQDTDQRVELNTDRNTVTQLTVEDFRDKKTKGP